MEKRLEANITGRVQGIGFRFFIKNQADDLGLIGFVRNLEDGSVQVVAEGEEKKLSKFEDILRKGSNYSLIEKFDINYFSALEEYDKFSIL
ncbi:MAG TPA: acylphosphatase [Candidatus Vogelbacteria bacterium]|nr:acylphosphatase [Candidatus Vogelbacteria bacterium]